MKIIVYLNRWHATLWHAILSATDGELDYTLASHVATTEAEARRVVEEWRHQHAVDEVRDNSAVALSELLRGIEPQDFASGNN